MVGVTKIGPRNANYWINAVAEGGEDYYTKPGEAPGEWMGALAAELGLEGEVKPDAYTAVLAGEHPGTAEALVKRPAPRKFKDAEGRKRRLDPILGYDVRFSAPKSVSLLYAVGSAEVRAAILRAHDDAVRQAVGYLERHACYVQRGHGGKKIEPGTGLVAMAFRHRSSRAGDPALHTHLVTANMTRAVSDGRWLSLAAPKGRTPFWLLTLPLGDSLDEEGGGAKVTREGKTLLSVAPPTAIDATGAEVAVNLSVSGDLLTLVVSPKDSASFPILVDPLFQTYEWYAKRTEEGIHGGEMEGWSHWGTGANNEENYLGGVPSFSTDVGSTNLEPTVKYESPGLDLADLGGARSGGEAFWRYTVPRYFSEPQGRLPETFITKLSVTDMDWKAESEKPSPYVYMGLWGPSKGWASLYSHEGLSGHSINNMSYVYNFPNELSVPDVKTAEIGLYSTENVTRGWTEIYVGGATVEMSEPSSTIPKFAELYGPTEWINQTPVLVNFRVEDAGLGVSSLTISGDQGIPSWKSTYNCTGVSGDPCPYSWKSSEKIEPAGLSEGINKLKVVSADPIGHVSTTTINNVPVDSHVEVSVDHTAPKVSVSGPITEQATLGTKRPTYALNYTATDGEAEPAAAFSPFGSAEAGNMQMKRPLGIVTDKSGHVWMVDREANCVKEFDEEGHYISQFGSTGSGNGQLQGPSDIARTPSGNFWVTDTGNHRIEEFSPSGAYLQQFEAIGSGPKAEIASPFGIATNSEGALWVGDVSSTRVGEFRENVSQESERFISSVSGPPGAVGPDLGTPTGIAIDSHNNVWVVDYGHGRLVEFNAKGEFITKFGSEGSGNGQLKYPFNIAFAPSGNLLVTDAGNNRVQEFQPDGNYLRQFGSTGTGNSQFSEPRDLALGANGTLFVEDAANHRITRWSHADYDPQSGVVRAEVKVDGTQVKEKYAPGCAIKDCAINREWKLNSSEYSAGEHTVEVIATDGVGLQTTKKLSVKLNPSPPALSLAGTMTEQTTLGTTRPKYKLSVNASAEAGLETPPAAAPSYASSLGSEGSGNGQLSHPGDVALDGKGHLWVTDENNNRVEEFGEGGEYLAQFGSTGTGNGQFSRPTSIAIDPKGHLWVTDAGNRRVQEFSEAGAYMAQFGSVGTGNGQFSGSGPEGIAIDPKGNVWVSDTYGARIEEFSEAGAFVKAVGTRGSGQGQLVEPTGIDIGPGGTVWVADWANNRVEVYSEAGAFVRQFGTEGSANGQFKRPDALAIDTRGDVWVGDQNNERVQEFNQSGEYAAQFGSAGSGAGQFNFSYPMGIAVSSKGSVWITDTANNRVQKWSIPGYGPSYAGSYGSSGTGSGQFNHPAGAAADTEGNLWIVDAANNRVEKLNGQGEYVSKFGTAGSGNGQFKEPTAIAADTEGNLWVTDTGNNRVEKFNGQGEYLSKFGTAGSGNGQFKEPEGIAVGPGAGAIFVVDRGNNRIERFTKTGAYFGQVGIHGSENQQFIEPTGIALGAPYGENAYTLLITDSGNNRVQRLGMLGEFIAKFGSSGAADGRFNHPGAIAVDAIGDVWVADQGNSRLEEFNQSGEYLTQAGSAGSGSAQFGSGYPMGIATDSKGNIWIADTANNRVQRWTQPNWSSEIFTEITVDGKRVSSGTSGCMGEHCPVTREWALESSAYSPGQHTVVAKATDGLGNTATKTLQIEIQRDTTKPSIEAAGELFEAPEGWVEQESYALAATAKDSGYGATSLAFKIDGQSIASTSKACPEGGCESGLSKAVDMAAYAGGAHKAELVATDGAGNTATKQWTINVDPEGQIPPGEATATLEAVESTTEETPVASTADLLEREQIEGGDNPGLRQNGSEIESTGVPDKTTMTTNPAEGFTIQSPDGDTTVTPLVSEVASDVTITEGVAGVASNVEDEVDSVIRPEYNGVQTFQAIRSSDSPNSFAWRVHLAQGQSLRGVNDHYAEVVYEDETIAFLITAEAAHDATGKPVPTSLEVSGDVVTLNVKISSAEYVYPIVSGQGWETSYTVPVIVEGPEDETEIKEREEREREEAEREAAEGQGPVPSAPPQPISSEEAEALITPAVERNSDVEAPPYPPPGEASASNVRNFTVHEQHVCQEWHCGIWKVWIAGGSSAEHPVFVRGLQYSAWTTTEVHCGDHYDTAYALLGLSVSEEGCGFAGAGKVWKGEDKHLTIWTRHTISVPIITDTVMASFTKHLALLVWIWPNGFQQKVVRDFETGTLEG